MNYGAKKWKLVIQLKLLCCQLTLRDSLVGGWGSCGGCWKYHTPAAPSADIDLICWWFLDKLQIKRAQGRSSCLRWIFRWRDAAGRAENASHPPTHFSPVRARTQREREAAGVYEVNEQLLTRSNQRARKARKLCWQSQEAKSVNHAAHF